jgi:hypothetical protein
MFPKPLAYGLLALSCVTAAAGGAYLATRHNAAEATVTPAAPAAGTTARTAPAATAVRPQPVSETEAAIGSGAPRPDADKPSDGVTPEATTGTPPESTTGGTRAPVIPDNPSAAPAAARRPPERARPTPRAQPGKAQLSSAAPSPKPAQNGGAPGPVDVSPLPPLAPINPPAAEPARAVEPLPEPPTEPQFEEVVLPVSSVIGLQLDTPLSSDRARLEDRVDARVMRDVLANGRVAIPAGSRVVGSVMLIERGGKLKERARLGIRFHTLVLAGGSEIALRTEPIYREGESPSGDSARKIGGAAIGGAILGAILGGGKGAVIGGTTGAAGGTAAVMAGDRNPVTLSPGTVMTARLSSPVSIQVEKR